jgi:hypothetical protein
MYNYHFDIESRLASSQEYVCPSLPSEFRGIVLKPEAGSRNRKAAILIKIAKYLIKTGNAILETQLKATDSSRHLILEK